MEGQDISGRIEGEPSGAPLDLGFEIALWVSEMIQDEKQQFSRGNKNFPASSDP